LCAVTVASSVINPSVSSLLLFTSQPDTQNYVTEASTYQGPKIIFLRWKLFVKYYKN
jgi:hypothetical protein